MLEYLKQEQNLTTTENGAKAYNSSENPCLDLFFVAGGSRKLHPQKIMDLFTKAYVYEADTAMRILFYARDVHGGLGERRFFRVLLRHIACTFPASMEKNIALIPEYGRFDDVLSLLGTPCEDAAISFLYKQLQADLDAMEENKSISLLAKWLPSVNTSSKKACSRAKLLCKAFGMSEKLYRQTLADLRYYMDIVETRLCERDYTFPYSAVPSCAMLKYREAFIRNDYERFAAYMNDVWDGKVVLHAETLYPYDIVRKCRYGHPMSMTQQNIMVTIQTP